MPSPRAFYLFDFFVHHVIYGGCCSRFLSILFVFGFDFNQINDDLEICGFLVSFSSFSLGFLFLSFEIQVVLD